MIFPFKKQLFSGILLFAFIGLLLVSFALPQQVHAQADSNEPGVGDDAVSPVSSAGGSGSPNIRIVGGCGGTDFACYLGQWFQEISVFLGNLALQIIGRLLELAAFLAELMIKLGKSIMSFPMVTNGFRISLSLVNFLFVSAVILMAFATMFRWGKYDIKAMFFKLILAALLVNFSFLIAGVILDTSNVLTDSFIFNFDAEKIGSAIQPQQLIVAFFNDPTYKRGVGYTESNAPSGFYESLEGTKNVFFINRQGGWPVFLLVLMGLVFSVIFQFILMLTVFAVALMLFVRNIWIAFLLILMPLAWGAWLLPKLSENWSKWWQNFITWVLYLPTVAFFLFLAITTLQLTVATGFANSPLKEVTSAPDLLQIAFQLLLTIGLLLGGLKAAKSISLAGGSAAMSFGAYIGRNTLKLGRTGAGLGIRGVGAAAAAAVPGKAIKERATTRFGERLGSLLSLPGRGIDKLGKATAYSEKSLPKAFEGVIDKGQKAVGTKDLKLSKGQNQEERNQEKIQKIFKDQYSDKNEEQLLLLAKEASSLPTLERTALARALKEKKALDKVEGEQTKKSLLAATKKTKSSTLTRDLEKELAKRDPLFGAKNKGQNLMEYLKTLKGDDLAEIPLEKIGKEERREVAKMLVRSSSAVSKKAAGSLAEREMLEKEILSLLETVDPEYVSLNPGGAQQKIQKEIAQLDRSLNSGEITDATTLTSLKKQLGAKMDTKNLISAYYNLQQTPGNPGKSPKTT